MKNQKYKITTAAIALCIIWFISSCIYTLNESQQAMIVRFGAPIEIENQPGIHFKLPLVDFVSYYDMRLMILEPSVEQVILGDQKRIEIQTYIQYKISNPLLFFQTLHTQEQAELQLSQIVNSALRHELGKVSLQALLSSQRQAIVDNIKKEVAEKTKNIGIETAEVRLKRADLPAETSQAIYDRMKSERIREAKELRAQGFEWSQAIQSDADKNKTTILSEAERKSRIIRGEADAKANEILSEAFKKDPQFYKFYRTLKTYRTTLADTNATIILSPEMEFMKYFKQGPAQR